MPGLTESRETEGTRVAVTSGSPLMHRSGTGTSLLRSFPPSFSGVSPQSPIGSVLPDMIHQLPSLTQLPNTLRGSRPLYSHINRHSDDRGQFLLDSQLKFDFLLLLLKCCFTSTETAGLLGTGLLFVLFPANFCPADW